MQLYTTCQGCGKEIVIKSGAVTRPDLEREQGEYITIKCDQCPKREQVDVNDIIARPNSTILWLGLVLGVASAVFLWWIYRAIGLISLGLPIIIWQQHSVKVDTFNRYKIKTYK